MLGHTDLNDLREAVGDDLLGAGEVEGGNGGVAREQVQALFGHVHGVGVATQVGVYLPCPIVGHRTSERVQL